MVLLHEMVDIRAVGIGERRAFDEQNVLGRKRLTVQREWAAKYYFLLR